MEANNKHVGIPLRSSPPESLHHYSTPTNSFRRPPLHPELRLWELNRKMTQKPDETGGIWWDTFASEFFDDEAQLHLQICFEDGVKTHRLSRSLIPRFFRSLFDGGATSVEFSLPNPVESFLPNGVVRLESPNGVMTTTTTTTNDVVNSPSPVKAFAEGHLVVDFGYDELMRIRLWDFTIRHHFEMISRHAVAATAAAASPVQANQTMNPALERLTENSTKLGLNQHTLNFLKLCTILQPMQELMSRHKTYNIPPRECLKTTLFNKWQQKNVPVSHPMKIVSLEPAAAVAPPPILPTSHVVSHPSPLTSPAVSSAPTTATKPPPSAKRLKRKRSQPSTPASMSSQPSTPTPSGPNSVVPQPTGSSQAESGGGGSQPKRRSPEVVPPLQRTNSGGSLSGRASVSSAVQAPPPPLQVPPPLQQQQQQPAPPPPPPPPPLSQPGSAERFVAHDIMVVGEPSLMGGEFGEEDERLIARLENVQFDPNHGGGGPATLTWPPAQGENEDSLG